MNLGKRVHRFYRYGFTLAEVLITLGLIGVIAAITLPSLITSTVKRAETDKQANIVYKITQATDKMRAEGALHQYDSTDAFVDEFQKYIKIIKRCDSNHIADCWPTKTVIDSNGKVMEVSSVKTGAQLNLAESPGKAESNTVGLILADGTSIIMVYDTTSEGVADSDSLIATSYILPYGSEFKTYKGYTTNTTAGLSFVTDINGSVGPNKEMQIVDSNSVTYDIRSFNGAHFGSNCAGTVVEGKCYFAVPSYSAITCSSSLNRAYCNWSDSYQAGSSGLSYTSYHAGAKKACADLDMKMISLGELNMLIANNGELFKKIAPSNWTNIWADNASAASSTSSTYTSTSTDYSNCLEYRTSYSCGEYSCGTYRYCYRYATKTNTTTSYSRSIGSATTGSSSGSTTNANVNSASYNVICVQN